MGTALKKKTAPTDEEFILMRRTRALLSETWDLWRESFEQSPVIAKRVMAQGLKELHRAEKEIQQKAQSRINTGVKSVKKAVKKKVRKLKAKA